MGGSSTSTASCGKGRRSASRFRLPERHAWTGRATGLGPDGRSKRSGRCAPPSALKIGAPAIFPGAPWSLAGDLARGQPIAEAVGIKAVTPLIGRFSLRVHEKRDGVSGGV